MKISNSIKISQVAAPVLLAVALLFFQLKIFGQATADPVFPDKPTTANFVYDYSNWLNTNEKDQLERKLQRYLDSTSTPIVIVIRPDLGGYDKAGYAIELLNRWQIGVAGKNNGILVLVKSEPPERGVFIATGYGAEGALPDILAARITRNIIIPKFQQQRYFEGLDDGTSAIIEAMRGEFKSDPRERSGSFLLPILVVVFVLLFLYLMWQERRGGGGRRKTYSNRDDDFFSNRRGGGGGWYIGGGGFGGGGGGSDSGGWGGSSGDIFGGGFGGGGGAGGDW